MPNAPRTFAAIVAAIAVMAGTHQPVRAQSEIGGEWQQRVAPGTKAIPKAAAPQAPAGAPAPKPKVKSQAVAPEAAPTAPIAGAPKGPAASPKQSLGPTSVPNESIHSKPDTVANDPAYDAYDQGKYLTALQLAEKAARNGDAQAYTLIGRIYAEGLALPQDMAIAAKAYAKAAELGDIEGTFNLGVLYSQGSGVEKNLDTAATYFEKAALKGHALANYNLALLFVRGKGKTENPRRGFAHMLYAAERGVVSAQYDVGTMLTTGIGTEANAFEGAKWIGKAARAGHVEAEIEYAIILFRTDAIPDDKEAVAQQQKAYREAVALLQSAAEKNHPVAHNRLARCYAHGLGVAVNLVEAAKWNFIARDGGIEDEALDKMLAKLSKAERQKAQVAAEEWRERSQVQ